jgi:carboxyl-terminal processing protease
LKQRKQASWLMLVTFLMAALLTGKEVFAGGPPIDEIRNALRKYLPLTPDEQMLLSLKVQGLDEGLREIDQYTRLFRPEEYKPLSLPEHGLIGIGADLFFKNGRAFLSPYQGGPMALAGIRDRVELTAVDGLDVKGAAPDNVAQWIKGKAETFVELSIKSLNQDNPYEVRLQRKPFQPLNVELLHDEDQVILQIRTFRTAMTNPSLRASIEHVGPNLQQLIIDLRESTGGDIYEAFDCAALFLPEGSRLGGIRLHDEEETFFFSRQGKKFNFPLILLVGPDTASAAEAFATALRYHGRALLIGRPTFGKCSTQTDVHLSGGWVLRVTNGLTLSPDGAKCNGIGLHPDIMVDEKELFDLERLVERTR